jgi:hypothetical protein
MIDQLLLGFQALFLVLLYLFIWRVMRTASRDLRLPQESTFLMPAPSGVRSPEPPPARGRLVVASSPSLAPGTTFELGAAPVAIGRSSENDVALASDEYASARHARVEPLRDGVWLVDLGSTNGTYVNDRRVDGRELLHEDDVVRIGETELRVER